MRATVTHVMEPVLSGCGAVLTIAGGCDETTVTAVPLENAPAGDPGKDASVAGEPVRLDILQRTDECFTVHMPDGPHRAWAFDADEGGDPLVANRPRLNWTFPERAVAGGTLRVLGRNLVRADRYVPGAPDAPASHGRLLDMADGDDTRARLVGEDGMIVPVVIEQASAYEARLSLPADLAPGAWSLRMHNGLGGAAGWSEPLPVAVDAADVWPEEVFAVDEYVSRGDDTDDAFAAALADLEKNGGGVLLLGPRRYRVGRTLRLPPKTVVRGAGAERTLVETPFRPPAADPPFVVITGDRDFVVEDLTVTGVYAPLLICAPAFVPETQDEAVDGARALSLAGRKAENVTVRRCAVEQHPFRQTMRRKDFDQRGWMAGFAERGWASIGGKDHWAAVFFCGSNLVVEDCRILGGGHAVDLYRTSHARVSRNTLRAGFFGMGLHGFTRLTWPEGGGGAKIEGNEMRRVIVEDNDVAARSEFARNLVSFNYGGDDLHIVRNHIHDIAPNCDSEALMTHLWQARWPTPTLEMTGPVDGRIVDPEGEVADECLDGAWIDVVDGRGTGQLRRIVRRDGERVEIDRPWRGGLDGTSRAVFTAPAPFRNLTIVDNRVVSQAVNIITWGTTWETVIDGNTVSEGPGVTVWSVRLAADQKVWGGAIFTTVMNNTAEGCRTAPGIANMVSFAEDGPRHGYDWLGFVVRNNVCRDNSPIEYTTRFDRGDRPAIEIRDAGVLIERNTIERCVRGLVVGEDARAVVRDNTLRDVEETDG